METHSLAQLNLLDPHLRDTAIKAYNEAVAATPSGVHPYIDETFRTFSESQKLWDQGRTAPGDIVTYALPGHSWHNYALALDFHLIIDGKDYWPADAKEALNNENWMIVVRIFEKYGFNSGLYFPEVNGKDETDPPHLENKLGQTITTMLAKYNAKDFIPGTEYINF